jgi:hypothetical protein
MLQSGELPKGYLTVRAHLQVPLTRAHKPQCMVYKCLKGGGFEQVSIYADDDVGINAVGS